jgi:hypothetical protein
MVNRKGESLGELFARRDRAIRDRIHAARPVMTYEEFMAITTDKKENRYRMAGPNKDLGAVLVKDEDGTGNFELILYRLK